MKTLLFFIVILVLVVFTAVSIDTDTTESLVSKPTMRSVVYGDRPYCVKISELNMIDDWEKRCTESGKDADCQLPEASAKSIFTSQQLNYENCERFSVR